MRKSLVSLGALVAGTSLVLVLALGPGAGAKSPRTIKFTGVATGGQIGGNQEAFKYHDSYFGDGAGVQTSKINGLNGSDATTTYYGNGSAKSVDTFKLGAPDANGIATITGSGKDVSGTGRAKGLKSTFTFTGTLNTKTLTFKVTLKGTYTLP